MNSKSQKLFKNSLLVAGILLTCGVANAQSANNSDSTHRSPHHWGPRRGGDGPGHRDGNGGERGGFAGRGHGDFRNRRDGIHYTQEQRTQLMAINKEFRDKSDELFKKDNISLKEYKANLIALQKDRRSKMTALLTPQQKDQLASRKKSAEENRQVAEAARMERLKLHLNLSDDQVTKIKAGQADLHAQAKAIHDNDDLLPQEKMEQMRGLMARRKDVFKSVLTPEQFSKFEEMSRQHGFGHDGPGGRPGWNRGRHAAENDGSDGGQTTAI
jgi:Spy/CpxP family protein refolding chaperone